MTTLTISGSVALSVTETERKSDRMGGNLEQSAQRILTCTYLAISKARPLAFLDHGDKLLCQFISQVQIGSRLTHLEHLALLSLRQLLRWEHVPPGNLPGVSCRFGGGRTGGFGCSPLDKLCGFLCASRPEGSLQEEEADGANQRSASRPADVIRCSLGRGFLDTAGCR